MNVSIENNYQNEIDQALTEDLLGVDADLALGYEDERVQYYVNIRSDDSKNFESEERFYQKFMPPASGKPVFHIIGAEGSGKSTFLRFFFGYYFLHRPTLRGEADLMRKSHENFVKRHLLLYCNLKKCHDETQMMEVIRNALIQNLTTFSKLQANARFDVPTSLERILEQLQSLAKETNSQNERNWFISIIFDNSDLMSEALQKKLYSFIEQQVGNENRTEHPFSPVTKREHSLWRIILTTRPETHANLRISFTPDRYVDTFLLPPVNQEQLLQKRACFIEMQIKLSDRHFEQDEFTTFDSRPILIITPPHTAGMVLAENLRSTIFLDGTNETDLGESDSIVHGIVSNLTNGSARRLLKLLPRAKFSPVVRRRLSLCIKNGWPATIRSFYFYWGLICGKYEWRPENVADELIPNFYRFGAHSGECYSVFIGMHSISLLSREYGWTDCKKILASIGYRSADIESCEQHLCACEVIKPLWLGPGDLERFQVETLIAKGLYNLAQQRAYTDIMAVDTADNLKQTEHIVKTDPVEYDQIIGRINSTTIFLEQLLKLETEIYKFDDKQQGHISSFQIFCEAFRRFQIKSITLIIASEYFRRVCELRKHAQVAAALSESFPEWLDLTNRIKHVQKAANRLSPYQS